VSVDAFYRDVARIALAVADKHGFVLGGGVAWLVNGLVQRPTEDVDLFTDTAGGVTAAAGEVSAALTAAGYRVVREEGDELFAGMAEDIQEFLVAAPGRALRLTLCRLDRRRAPVVMDLGPVMHLDDLVATKVAALVTGARSATTSTSRRRLSVTRSGGSWSSRTTPTRRSTPRTSPTPGATWTGSTTCGSPCTAWTPRRSPGCGSGWRRGPARDQPSMRRSQ
jgi:hypothetical protein